MLQLLGRNIYLFSSHKLLQLHLPKVLLIPQHILVLLLECCSNYFWGKYKFLIKVHFQLPILR